MMKNDRPGTGPLEMQRDVMGDEVANLDEFWSSQKYIAAPEKAIFEPPSRHFSQRTTGFLHRARRALHADFYQVN
ncbi:MAG TPA: hypothetical protein QF694_05320 [Dehalococcoidia bacterium]|jgi:hypothetical protein|nr:hypothetical protein [Dehalococcoidia bacterium]HJP28211.1 hypothetical protein [Dehalococcoidia bacterium]|tara:strand:+ start:11933 stop:12157 length:225 start_codon:yes stop_codon:yes gene_type:complete